MDENTGATKSTINILIPSVNRQEAEEILSFLRILNQEEKKEFFAVIRAARFLKSLSKEVVE